MAGILASHVFLLKLQSLSDKNTSMTLHGHLLETLPSLTDRQQAHTPELMIHPKVIDLLDRLLREMLIKHF